MVKKTQVQPLKEYTNSTIISPQKYDCAQCRNAAIPIHSRTQQDLFSQPIQILKGLGSKLKLLEMNLYSLLPQRIIQDYFFLFALALATFRPKCGKRLAKDIFPID